MMGYHYAWSVILCSIILPFISCQTPTNFGVFDGRVIRVDDHLDGTHGHDHGRAIGRVGGIGSPIGMPFGGALGNLGGAVAGVLGGLLPGLMGSIGNPATLPRCRAFMCPMQHFIQPRCSYTPVYRSAFGTYCKGCEDDICHDSGHHQNLGSGQRRRRRRIRRLMCARFGICSGRRGRRGRGGIGAGLGGGLGAGLGVGLGGGLGAGLGAGLGGGLAVGGGLPVVGGLPVG